MDSSETGTRRIRLDLSYDGTRFSGWARQPGLRTVQGELEAALAVVFRRKGDPPRLTVAGRTDVGVHATGQVAHVDLTPAQLALLDRPDRGGAPAPRGPAALARRLNGIAGLESDVRVSRSEFAPEGFDARFSALWRRYEYRIADRAAAQDPLRRFSTLWHPGDLDVEAMDDAARSLLGLHDFATFCKPREGATTIRTLQAFSWSRDDAGVLIARLQADAFCRSMVRAIVGACVAVGAGKLTAARAVELREAAVRTSEFVVMPAKGLTLTEVRYPPDAELGIRAEQTRAKRGLPEADEID
ncbi:MAG TPA: tRNA pseudouridine(38-40) synthase TruA [Pseudolysinimonas sp.]|nr:tRNA pseudouridine(38-40) synthase TruA [Pseudolysinimonas sp.]